MAVAAASTAAAAAASEMSIVYDESLSNVQWAPPLCMDRNSDECHGQTPPHAVLQRAKRRQSTYQDYLLLRRILASTERRGEIVDCSHNEKDWCTARSLCQTARLCCLAQGYGPMPVLCWSELPEDLRNQYQLHTTEWQQMPPANKDALLIAHPKCRKRWEQIKAHATLPISGNI